MPGNTFQFQHLPVTDHRDTTAVLEQTQSLLRAGLTTGFLANGAVTEPKLSKAVQEALKPSAWTTLTLAESLEFNAETYAPAVRTESNGACSRLRGLLKAKAGKELKAGEAACTLAAAFRPSKTVIIGDVKGTKYVNITTAGVVSFSINIAAGEQFALDGLTFSIT